MAQSIISAGDASNGLTTQAGNDGTLVIQSGPAGGKVNAISIAANGTVSMPLTGSLGVGQTWQTVTRTAGTTYTNNTGLPIMVVYTVNIGNGTSGGSVNLWNGSVSQGLGTGAAQIQVGLSFIVPPNGTYSYTQTGTVNSVSVTELR